MDKPRIYVDFNEMVESNLVLLSQSDSKIDSAGNTVALYEGLEVAIYSDDDLDEDGMPDCLIAEGVVERNTAKDWSAHVKWCCRINEDGIRHVSELRELR